MAVIVFILLAIIAVVIIGGLVIGFAVKLLWWALIGLVIGAIARAILPGKQNLSIIATAGVGLAASIVGGILAHVFGLGGILQFLVAIGLAIVFVLALRGSRFARV